MGINLLDIKFENLFPGFKISNYIICDNNTDIYIDLLYNKYILVIGDRCLMENPNIEYTRIIIHEMFHIFQLENIVRYRDIKYTRARKKDINYVVQLLNMYKESNYEKIKLALKEELESEKDYILNIEDIEGTALYVELKFLEEYYNQNMYNEFKKIYRIFLNGRYHLLPYILGCVYCFTLDDVNKNWKYEYGNSKKLVHQILYNNI